MPVCAGVCAAGRGKELGFLNRARPKLSVGDPFITQPLERVADVKLSRSLIFALLLFGLNRVLSLKKKRDRKNVPY